MLQSLKALSVYALFAESREMLMLRSQAFNSISERNFALLIENARKLIAQTSHLPSFLAVVHITFSLFPFLSQYPIWLFLSLSLSLSPLNATKKPEIIPLYSA